jgi:hypothetical protein
MEYTEGAAPANIKVPRFGRKIEHTIVRGLIRALKRKGFAVHSIAVDGEDTYVRTETERAAVCEVFEWDAFTTLRFKRVNGDDDDLYGVLLVPGNGEDIISDYTWDGGADVLEPDAGTFAHAVQKYSERFE